MKMLDVLNYFYSEAGMKSLCWRLEIPGDLSVEVRGWTVQGSLWADLGVVWGDGRDVELAIHALTGLPCHSE